MLATAAALAAQAPATRPTHSCRRSGISVTKFLFSPPATKAHGKRARLLPPCVCDQVTQTVVECSFKLPEKRSFFFKSGRALMILTRWFIAMNQVYHHICLFTTGNGVSPARVVPGPAAAHHQRASRGRRRRHGACAHVVAAEDAHVIAAPGHRSAARRASAACVAGGFPQDHPCHARLPATTRAGAPLPCAHARRRSVTVCARA